MTELAVTAPGTDAGEAGTVDAATEQVVVLDYGGQYSQLIARRLRECGVFSELLPHHVALEEVAKRKPRGIVLSGGPASVYAEGAPRLDRGLLELGVPVMGICYGMQLLVHELGGRVEQAEVGEFGRSDLQVSRARRAAARHARRADLLDVAPRHRVRAAARLHRAGLLQLVAGRGRRGASSAASTASSSTPRSCTRPTARRSSRAFSPRSAAASRRGRRRRSSRSRSGGFARRWATRTSICGLSGGVDSSVAALLVHRAIGDAADVRVRRSRPDAQGRGRAGRSAPFATRSRCRSWPSTPSTRFLDKLVGVTEPEAKRKAIGAEFIRVFEEEAAKLADADGEGARFLVQGTLYSDVIESGGGTGAATIKSHHNVGGLPDDLQFELVEPLRALFKDEVRAVGAELGLPERLVWRQPFPGPGLAIRVVGGEATKERLNVLREADHILQEEIRKAGLYRELWQSFCVLPDVRTVGVQGDERTYGYVVVLRAVTSDDAMTADWARLPYDLLETIASRMINELREVNRVVLDITTKPPGTIEWE